MDRVADLRLEIPGSNPGLENNFFFFLRKRSFFAIFFGANSTHTSTHALNLRKFAKTYNKRNIDAESAHVASLRRYCAN